MGAVYELEDSGYVGLIEDDTMLSAEVIEVKPRELPFKDDDGKPVIKVSFKFKVDDPASPFDGQIVYGETPTTFTNHVNCLFRAWVEEILAVDLPVKYRLDTDILAGNHCRIVIGVKRWEKNGKQEERNRVKDVIRSRETVAAISEPF